MSRTKRFTVKCKQKFSLNYLLTGYHGLIHVLLGPSWSERVCNHTLFIIFQKLFETYYMAVRSVVYFALREKTCLTGSLRLGKFFLRRKACITTECFHPSFVFLLVAHSFRSIENTIL